MALSIQAVTHTQRERILALVEGHFADLKAKEIAPAKLTKTVSAFANADGGEVYIGVAEDKTTGQRTWEGFADPEAANGHIQAFEALFPLGRDFSYNFLSSVAAPGLVLQVLVHKTRDIKRATDGVPYLRRGAQSLPIDTPEKLRRLELDKGVASFESDTVSAELALVTNSIAVLEFMIEVIPTSEPEAWLHKQQLVQGGRPTWRAFYFSPTNRRHCCQSAVA